MIISHEHRFIFFCNGKTGTTSIENALKAYNDDDYSFSAVNMFNAKHIPPGIAKAVIKKDIWDSYFKFVFVRNPWDWFVSNWKYNFKYLNLPNYFFTSPKEIIKLGFILERNRIAKKKPFSIEDVLKMHSSLKRFRAYSQHDSYYQSDYVYDVNQSRIVDFVGRFEQLENDAEYVFNKLGIEIKLPHLNQTRNDDYKDYFTEESRQAVFELWNRDVKSFGYKF